MTEVPIIVLTDLTPTQRRALVLADNRLALNAGWNEAMLRVELESLQEYGFDIDLVGFTDDEIEEILRDPEDRRRADR
jgi:ParB-like chromosome segregation protein Spo0J